MSTSQSVYSQLLSKIGEKLYLKPERSDVCFVFETTDERIPAHKNILSSASDVFEAMFYGPLKEEGDIKIVDASAEAFREFLGVFYFNKIRLSEANVSEVMYLGKKYNVPECLRVCADFTATIITAKNVIYFLGLALVYDQAQLKESCEKFISSNAKETLQSSHFQNCDRTVLDHIVNINCLSCSEDVVFEACMSWVKATSKQDQLTKDIIQTHLGETFYAIRYGSMTIDEFLKLVPSYGHLFTGDEYNEILTMISKRDTNPKIFTKYRRTQPAQPLPIKKKTMHCNMLGSYEDDVRRDFETWNFITFSVNKPVLLKSFSIDGLRMRGAHNEYFSYVKIQVVIYAGSDLKSAYTFSHCSNDGGEIDLQPLMIIPGTQYKIELQLQSDETYYTSTIYQIKPFVSLDEGVVVHFFDGYSNIKGPKIFHSLGFLLPK